MNSHGTVVVILVNWRSLEGSPICLAVFQVPICMSLPKKGLSWCGMTSQVRQGPLHSPKSLSYMLNLWFYLWRDGTEERCQLCGLWFCEGGQRLTLGVFFYHILLYCYRQGLSPSLKLVLWLQAWSLLLTTRVHQKAPRIVLSLLFPVWGLKAQVVVLGFHMGLGIWTQVSMLVQ